MGNFSVPIDVMFFFDQPPHIVSYLQKYCRTREAKAL